MRWCLAGTPGSLFSHNCFPLDYLSPEMLSVDLWRRLRNQFTCSRHFDVASLSHSPCICVAEILSFEQGKHIQTSREGVLLGFPFFLFFFLWSPFSPSLFFGGGRFISTMSFFLIIHWILQVKWSRCLPVLNCLPNK